MSETRSKSLDAAASWLRSTFWDEVEYEIEELDWHDFLEFLQADSLSIPLRPEFREQLRGRLHEYVRTRYSS